MNALHLPIESVSRVERTLMAAAGVTTSPFSGVQQVQAWGGAWWVYSFDIALTRGPGARAMSAFLAALQGPVGTFLWREQSARGQADLAAHGAPIVAGPGQSGTALLTEGWTLEGEALPAGAMVSLGTGAATRLHQLTAPALADAAGRATLALVPALRESPADQAPVEIAAPVVRLRLAAPVPVAIGRADFHRFTITAREAL